jgi:hypothetical protein
MSKRVEQNGKTLYHIQAEYGTTNHDSTYDLFIWSVDEPTEEQIAKAYIEDMGEVDKDEVKDFLEMCNTYMVHGNEV